MEILYWIILMTFINGLLAFAGIFTFFIPKKIFEKIIIFLVAFTTGTLLGGAFFHFLPEAFEKISLLFLLILVLVGFMLFFLLEKYVHWRHCHEGECEVHPVSYLILYGDSVHNFIDGLIIAGSFLISVPFGIISSLLVMAHELPQEIGDFGVLVYGGFEKNKALFYNFFAQLFSVLGGILGFYFFSAKEYLTFLLPIAAGGFLYIALADLIPEVFKEKKPIKILINIIVIILGLLLLLSAKTSVG